MYQPGCWVHIPTPPLFIQVTAMFWRARFSIIQLLQYSILLISHGYFSLKYSQQTLHNSPVRASYGVSLWVQSQPTLWFWCWHVVSNIMLYITMIYQEFTVQYLTNIFSNIHYTFDSYYIHSQPYRLLLILTITCLIYIYILLPMHQYNNTNTDTTASSKTIISSSFCERDKTVSYKASKEICPCTIVLQALFPWKH